MTLSNKISDEGGSKLGEPLTVTGIIVQPLCVHHVMHSDHVIIFGHGTTPYPPQLLHVPAHAQNQPQMHAQGSDIRASLAGDPEHGEVALFIKFEQLGFVDGPNAKLTFYGGDEGRALEEGAGEGLERTGQGRRIGEGSMETEYTYVFLS